MAEKFKSTDYVKIMKELIPELDYISNPLDIGCNSKLPSLRNIVVLRDGKDRSMRHVSKCMLNFEDLKEIYDSKDERELY